jgi:acyl-CoA thioesterase FadM
MDLGRVWLLACIGLLRPAFRRRWAPVLSAAEISFLRPITPFARFELATRLLGWDEKYFYIEQRFVAGGRLCAIAHVKGLFLSRHGRVPSDKVLEALNLNIASPELPEVVKHWNDLARLKKRDSHEGASHD